MTGGTPGSVCVFGTFDARNHPRIEVIEEGLRSLGIPVLRCNVPWDAPTSMRVRAVRRPWVAIRLGGRLLRAWVRLWRMARHVGPVDVVIVGYLGVLDVHLARWWWRDATIVLDHLAPVAGTLSDRRAGGRLAARAAGMVDRVALRRADLVVVDTDEHRSAGGRSVVAPVGAPARWFEARRESHRTPGPLRVVFFGLYTPLQGTPVIARAVADALDQGAELEVTMVGDGQDRAVCRQLLRSRAAVRWVDWLPAGQLATTVAGHDVCLGIFGTTGKARRVVPNKVFQGAAAGCAIVTGDTPPQRRLLADAALYSPPGDAGALAGLLVLLARDPDQVADARQRAATLADRSFRPEVVVRDLAVLLSSSRPRR